MTTSAAPAKSRRVELTHRECEALEIALYEYIRDFEPAGPMDRYDRQHVRCLRKLIERLHQR